MIFPSFKTSAKLFLTGSTIGPLVDSLHNQCLLEYDILPINIYIGNGPLPLISTSWVIPPLLGIAYVVLGGILPRILSMMFYHSEVSLMNKNLNGASLLNLPIREKAIAAVLSTVVIIRLSEYLETHSIFSVENSILVNVALMSIFALTQWMLLDGTVLTLTAATVTAFGGPLSELPFIANGYWHYIPSAADYFPLINFPIAESLQHLSLSSITGPCYFAVTMDSIALGRWFENSHSISRNEISG